MDISIDTYLKVILIIKATEAFLKVETEKYTPDPKTTTNIKYYVAMTAAINFLKNKENILQALTTASQINIDGTIFNESLDIVLKHYHELGGDDQVAKGAALTPAILASL